MEAGNDNPNRRQDTKLGRCPICRQPTTVEYRPFCSRRCADVDLSRWLGGRYAIAGGNVDEDEDGDDARAANQSYRTGGGDLSDE